ncbi:MAG: cyclophane-forming radical SAM/SPASM peptide maturase YhhB [Solirubrobacteraceae bacterium]
MTECITATAGPDDGQAASDPPPRITSFLLKVASRCNLACDYCYMYEHADQSWREQPKLMSEEVVAATVERVAEYADAVDLEQIAVILHGGEPLLAGAERLADIARRLRAAMLAVRVDVGLQTNGTLMDREALDILERENIGISISLDGPREATDRHRRTAMGRSSHDSTMAALELLRERPAIFAGMIAVIDPANDAGELLDFLAAQGPPRLDLLLPDANHLRPPPGRDDNPELYAQWLVEAFDAWYDRHATLPLRTFEAVLDGLAGLPSGTDALGFGDVSLLTIETDGSYHDLDVLKITAAGATALGGSVADRAIRDVAASERLAAHRALLRPDGVSETCRRCAEVNVCGGGSVPHRYAGDGFGHPSAYCHELLILIAHARRRMVATLTEQRAAEEIVRSAPRAVVDLGRFNVAEDAELEIAELHRRWQDEAEADLRAAAARASAADPDAASAAAELCAAAANLRRELAVQPAAAVWARVINDDAAGRRTVDLGGRPMRPAPHDLVRLVATMPTLAVRRLRWHPDEPWLRVPFDDGRVVFDDDAAPQARELAEEALAVVERWRPALAAEMAWLSRDVLFIRDLTAHPDKVVSFSDDSAPGALYCSVRRSNGLISANDLADSLIHEHRHQKLYLLDRYVPLVLGDRPLVSSPWREDPRPPSGLLHAVFVFVELLRFRRHLRDTNRSDRAHREVATIEGRLSAAFSTLSEVALTDQGRALAVSLEASAALT